jgi:divalent metal cation (Fe/Co/Zn/Cd) transporter
MKFLYKLFIKDYQNVNDSNVRVKYGVLAGTIGVVFNFLLVLMKFITGMIINSISMIGDAFNNLSDTCSSFVNIFSFKI